MFGLNDSNSQTNSSAPANSAQQSESPYPSPPASTMPSAPALPPEQSQVSAPTSNSSANDNGLLDIKTQALHSLAPLVDHLDQSPEEKFKTTMMLIQASDNASLIKDAYTAANQITDEKSRAQALLDVINEINYFTQGQNSAPAEKLNP